MKKQLIILAVSLLFITLYFSGCAELEDDKDNTIGVGPYIDSSKIKWTQTNGPPGGGAFFDLVQNPYNHDELYTLSEKGIYKSQDKGKTWRFMSELLNVGVLSFIPFEDGLFICGYDAVYFYDNNNLVKILDGGYWLITISDSKLFVASSEREAKNIRILFSNLTSQSYSWSDITPSENELKDLIPPPENVGFSYMVRPSNIVALGKRILVNIVLSVEGSGEYSNGHLYCSEDLGSSWSKVPIDMPDSVLIANIIQDSNDPYHLLLPLKHNIIHEFKSPISKLLKQSFDGGKTWSSVTNNTILMNAITEVEIVGSIYYLLCPYDSIIIRLNGSSIDIIDTPKVAGYDERISFPVDKILFDLDDPNTVYGKTGNSWALGLIMSNDGMKTWTKMDGNIICSSPTIVLCHPTNSSIIFTAGNVIQEKYFTTDSGTNWEPYSPTCAVDEIKIDPFNPNHILMVSEMSEIYESYDMGKTFTQINNDFWGAKVFDIAGAKDRPGTIYASNIGLGISKRTATASEWSHMTGSSDYAYRLEVDPQNSSTLYATYSPKIFENYSALWKYSESQSENFGWSEIFRVNNSKGITSLTFNPSDPNKIFTGVIGKEGTIYVTHDKGNTWSKLNKDLTFTTIWGHSQLQIDPIDKSTVYAGTWGGGTYKSTNGGKDWILLDLNHTFSPTWVAVSENNPNIVYACDRTEAKIHRSNDSGRTWYTYYDFGKEYLLTSVVVIDPNDPNMIYVSAFKPPMAHQGAFVKIKNGQKIADLGSGLPRSVIEMEIDSIDNNILYVTTHLHGVYKSMDEGITWQQLDDKGTGLPRTGIYDIDIDPVNNSILYATAIGGVLPEYMLPAGVENLEGKCGVYKSTDGGQHWTLVLETVSEARGIDIDPKDSRNLYVADMMGGVWVSNDKGENWRQENEGLGSISMTSVKVKDDYIYASTQGSGVYSGIIDTDGTITWDASRSNKPRAEVNKIQVECDPSNPERIYASAYPGGLLRSDDGGKHWNDKNFLTPSIKVTDPNLQGYYSFAINPSEPNIVWMGVYGKGIFVSYDGMDTDMFAGLAGKKITKVIIDPVNPDEVYVSCDEGVFKTEDNGVHWMKINDGLQTLDVKTLKILSTEWPPFDEGFDDLTTNQWSLWDGWSLTNDGDNNVLEGVGHTWANAGSDEWVDYTFEVKLMLNQGAIHVNFRLNDKGRYFLGFSENGLNLQKQFNNWTEFSELEREQDQYQLKQWYQLRVEAYGDNIRVYVNDALKINYTDHDPFLKGAIAFETLESSDVYVDDVSVRIKPETVLYAGTAGYGIYEFDDMNNYWNNLGRTLGTGWWNAWERRMYQFSSILFDSLMLGKVYLGHFPGGFFISEDNGHTWKDSSLGLGNDGIFSLTIHPYDRKIIWAGTYNGVAKSVDGGRTWKLKSKGMPSEQWPFTVAINEENPNIMYATTKNGQNKGLPHRNVIHGIVMKSTDGGENWFQIMNGLDNGNEFYRLIIHPSYHNILLLSSSNGVFVSNDAGETWQSIDNDLPSTYNQARDNVADNLAFTEDGDYLVLGLRWYGIWKADLRVATVLRGI